MVQIKKQAFKLKLFPFSDSFSLILFLIMGKLLFILHNFPYYAVIPLTLLSPPGDIEKRIWFTPSAFTASDALRIFFLWLLFWCCYFHFNIWKNYNQKFLHVRDQLVNWLSCMQNILYNPFFWFTWVQKDYQSFCI